MTEDEEDTEIKEEYAEERDPLAKPSVVSTACALA